MEVIIRPDYDEMSKEAAKVIAKVIHHKPNAVLGLATGSTPIGLYRELIRMHKNEGLDFSKCTTFNLDEYCGLSREHDQSYYYFMHDNLFNHINVPEEKIHVPRGTVDAHETFCAWYEDQIEKAGGIDVQVLGIGSDGHIAFNEPGSSLMSRTRIKTLTELTIDDNARFFEKKDDVPRYAITMGCGTIMEAKKCLLLINGKKKAGIAKEAIEGAVSQMVTASILQLHPDTVAILDEEGASELELKDYYKWVNENRPE